MQYNEYGQCWVKCDDLVELLYKTPDLNITNFLINDDNGIKIYNSAIDNLYINFPKLTQADNVVLSVEEFDQKNQNQWRMPKEYLDFDIAKWVLDQCQHEYELQRVGEELLLFQERDLFNLLRFLKYLVDVMRQNNIVWGVGRGSSVASYVLYLMGVHHIDSIFYQLDINEFLK